MKKINFNIKDRKILTLSLSLILVCVFTLTVAYSALTAVLTIQGNARVSAADWDIYLNNPRVTNGSATTNVPVIKTSSTLEFETTLNMPGDFYEFVVDVVNGGSIDAMIENVVKTPDLTEEQAKFLKYEVSYQNGESITTKRLLAKDTTMPIKVRIEYRKDLSNTDLPTGQVVLDLALTLEYVQSDGTGSSVKDNGAWTISANGDINDIGTIVTIGTEQFYTIGTVGDNVKLLAMYNLYVGGEYNISTRTTTTYGNEATGMQDINMLAWAKDVTSFKGITQFSISNYWHSLGSYPSYVYNSNSLLYDYVENYKALLETNFGVDVVTARLINYEELTDTNTFACVRYGNCSDTYPWIYSTSYWTGVASSYCDVLYVNCYANFSISYFNTGSDLGVRPVIIISKNYF